MYLVAIAWIYVVLMMAVAEAMSSQGSVLGAVITFLLYGALPLAIVLYILGAPARRQRILARERQELEAMKPTPADPAVSETERPTDSEQASALTSAGPQKSA